MIAPALRRFASAVGLSDGELSSLLGMAKQWLFASVAEAEAQERRLWLEGIASKLEKDANKREKALALTEQSISSKTVSRGERKGSLTVDGNSGSLLEQIDQVQKIELAHAAEKEGVKGERLLLELIRGRVLTQGEISLMLQAASRQLANEKATGTGKEEVLQQ